MSSFAAWTRAAVLAFGLLAATLLLGCPRSFETPEEAPDAWVTIGRQQVAVEVADTPTKQARGLGYRDSLDWDTGMYFPYDRPGMRSFWMRGMRFPIDIIWIRTGRIIDITHDVPHVPGENGPTVRPREAADAVLEVPAGYARARGWRVGNRVAFKPVVESDS